MGLLTKFCKGKKTKGEIARKTASIDAKLDFASPLVSTLLSLHDLKLAVLWLVSYGYLKYAQSFLDAKSKEFVGALHEGNLSPHDLQTEGFCEGLKMFHDYFMVERLKEKRNTAKRIFVGFVSSGDRAQFRIERMYNALGLLELDDLEILRRVKKDVVSKVLQERVDGYKKSEEAQKADGITLEKYLDNQKVKGWPFKQNEANRIASGMSEGLSNLESLRIISVSRSQGYNGQNSTYKLTPFGYEFCQFISDAS